MWGYFGGIDISCFNFLCYASLAFDALETVKKLIPSKKEETYFREYGSKQIFCYNSNLKSVGVGFANWPTGA